MRIDQELFAEAQAHGRQSSRSAAQQIDYWARIGKELEASSAISHRDIERVLAGDGNYDALSERAQAIVRAEWDERVEARRAALNFEEEFAAAGRRWTDAHADGTLVSRGPQPAGS